MADAPPPAQAADGAPALKRARLATTELARPAPSVTHVWTLENLTAASFTGAARTDNWLGPVFLACGLRWRLEVRPNSFRAGNAPCQACAVSLMLLDATPAPVRLAEVTMLVGGGERTSLLPLPYFHSGLGGSHGMIVSHSSLVNHELQRLPDGKMTITVVMRSRTFAETAVPEIPQPSLLADLAAAQPAEGAAPADGADVVFKAAGGERRTASFWRCGQAR